MPEISASVIIIEGIALTVPLIVLVAVKPFIEAVIVPDCTPTFAVAASLTNNVLLTVPLEPSKSKLAKNVPPIVVAISKFAGAVMVTLAAVLDPVISKEMGDKEAKPEQELNEGVGITNVRIGELRKEYKV